MDDRRYLEDALEEARKGAADGCVPVGSVIVAPDGAIVARGRNRVQSTGDLTAHAEVDAIRNAGRRLQDEQYRGHCTLYTTAEPCLMCTGAICWTGISRVVWAVRGPRGGGASDVMRSALAERDWIRGLTCIAEPYDDLRLASIALLKEYFTLRGDQVQADLWDSLA